MTITNKRKRDEPLSNVSNKVVNTDHNKVVKRVSFKLDCCSPPTRPKGKYRLPERIRCKQERELNELTQELSRQYELNAELMEELKNLRVQAMRDMSEISEIIEMMVEIPEVVAEVAH